MEIVLCIVILVMPSVCLRLGAGVRYLSLSMPWCGIVPGVVLSV